MPTDRGRPPEPNRDQDYNRAPEPEPRDAQSYDHPGVRASHPSTKRNLPAIAVGVTVAVLVLIGVVYAFLSF